MKTREIVETLKEYYETNLPAILSSYGIDNFEYYVSDPTTEEDCKELAFYSGGGFKNPSITSKTIIMAANLYRVGNPVDYMDALEELWDNMDIESLIGYSSKEYTFEVFYANVDEEAGSSSLVGYELLFGGGLDSCS